MSHVGQQRNRQRTQTAIFTRRVNPSQVREMRIHRRGYNFGSNRPELFDPVIESQYLCRANKRAANQNNINHYSPVEHPRRTKLTSPTGRRKKLNTFHGNPSTSIPATSRLRRPYPSSPEPVWILKT